MPVSNLRFYRKLVQSIVQRSAALALLFIGACTDGITAPESDAKKERVSLDWNCYGIWGADGTITTQCDWHNDPFILPPVADIWGPGYSGYSGGNPSFGNPGGGGYTGSYPTGPFTSIDLPPGGGFVWPETITGLREGGDDPTCSPTGICAPDRFKVKSIWFATSTQSGQQVSFLVENVWFKRIAGTFDYNDQFAFSDYTVDVEYGQNVRSMPAGIILYYLRRVHMMSSLQNRSGSWQGGVAQNGRQPIYCNCALTNWFGTHENVIFVPLPGGSNNEFGGQAPIGSNLEP